MTRLQIQMTVVAVASWFLPTGASAVEVDPPAVEWERTYSDGLFGLKETCMWPYDFQQTMDGGYILLDHNGVYLVKVDPQGRNEWEKAYDLDSASFGTAVQEKPDGSYVVSYMRTDPRDRTIAPGLMQADASGNLIWSKVLGSERGAGTSMDLTRDGGYVVAGARIYTDLGADVLLIKAAPEDGLVRERAMVQSFQPARHCNQS